MLPDNTHHCRPTRLLIILIGDGLVEYFGIELARSPVDAPFYGRTPMKKLLKIA